MSRYAGDRGSRREVAESGYEFLMMEVVGYFLYGEGTRHYKAPAQLVQTPSEQAQQDEQTTAETRRRLEGLGMDVGKRLIERYAMERDHFETDLDIVKFICKDFWDRTFKKHIDMLRTNNKGLYKLTDNNFRWISRISGTGQGHLEDYVLFPCGMICGALTRLGVRCRVTAEIEKKPLAYQVSFSIQVIQS